MKDRSDQVRMVKNEWISDGDVESPEKLGINERSGSKASVEFVILLKIWR